MKNLLITLTIILFASCNSGNNTQDSHTSPFPIGSWLDVEYNELIPYATYEYYDSIAANKYGSPNGVYFSYDEVLGDTIWIAEMNSGTKYPGLLKSWSAEHDSPEEAAEYLFRLYEQFETTQK